RRAPPVPRAAHRAATAALGDLVAAGTAVLRLHGRGADAEAIPAFCVLDAEPPGRGSRAARAPDAGLRAGLQTAADFQRLVPRAAAAERRSAERGRREAGGAPRGRRL